AYSLPLELIAQTPIEPIDQSRLMVLNRSDNSLKHHHFREIVNYLRDGDILVFNNSRVIPARLSGRKLDSGGQLEILLLRQLGPNLWETLVRPGRRVQIGTRIEINSNSVSGNGQDVRVTAEAIGSGEGGTRIIKFSDETFLPELGQIPLPPYIRVPLNDPARYQTVYAEVDGSIAAPTAGLHFTTELIDKIRNKGIKCLFVTLHVGLDTFQPVRKKNLLEHRMHKEYGMLNIEVASELSKAKAEGRRIIGVGTTTVRLLEAVAQASRPPDISAFAGWVSLFILPGYQFKMVDAMVTNFHLPRSTLLMLVSALGGKDLIDRAYREAIAQQYYFYSLGDAMLIL
ncbi:MAG: tRNA preQ1(34) S-adenosylmethionine ribosyltransferase-isomerase QueA, partial [Chloroflexi bacterium]|nr:tRNA preQ1(34) S-adenosylmethionine ribosyltransferase-isomerase QueA [Chloroflexota bacterium]